METYKRFQIAKIILRKKNGAGGIRLPNFRLCYKVTVIKTVWYWHKTRNIDQWNRIESPQLNPYSYGKLSMAKEARIHNGEKTALFNKWCWEKWIAICKIVKLEHNLTPYTRGFQFRGDQESNI